MAEVPFDDREERDPDAPTLVSVAAEMQTTLLRVRKLLITAGFYTTVTSREIQELAAEGQSVAEIMKSTRLSQASVYSYLPYTKGAYRLPDPTLYIVNRVSDIVIGGWLSRLYGRPKEVQGKMWHCGRQ